MDTFIKLYGNVKGAALRETQSIDEFKGIEIPEYMVTNEISKH